MPDANQLSQELSERGYGQLAEQVTAAIKYDELKMAAVIAKHISGPTKYDSVEEQAKEIAEDYVSDGLANAINAKDVWAAYFKAKYNIKYGEMDKYENGISGDTYSYWCTVTFPRKAVTTTTISLPWRASFDKEFERLVKRGDFNLDVKSLLKDKDFQKLLLAKVEEDFNEIVEGSAPPPELGRQILKREERIETKAWDTGKIDYETHTQYWSEKLQDWEDAAEGPSMDIRFDISNFGDVRFDNKDPIKVEQVKADPKNVSCKVVATFSIRFNRMYFPSEYGYQR
jgi:tRNA(Ser,Leu) C12 N-acetylase TAN1